MTLYDTRDFTVTELNGFTLRSVHLPYQNVELSGCKDASFYFYVKVPDPMEFGSDNVYEIRKVSLLDLSDTLVNTVSDYTGEAICGRFSDVVFEGFDTEGVEWGKLEIRKGNRFVYWVRYSYDPLDDHLVAIPRGFFHGKMPHSVRETEDGNVEVVNIKKYKVYTFTLPEELRNTKRQYFIWNEELYYLTSLVVENRTMSYGVYSTSTGKIDDKFSFLIGSTSVVSHPNYISYIRYNRLCVASLK